MTIKELETTLGMTRANIRFYEQEGLLSPARGANNYRIYTQEDVDTLRKLKLLRQLGLPLDTIRQVQRGELRLDAALARQQRTLEEQRSELAWADRVCSAMRSDRAEYATLDAQKYLDALDRPAEGEGYFSLNKDAAPMVAYPWRRFFARWLDMFLYNLLWSAFGLLVLRFNPPDNLFITLLSNYLTYLTVLLVEPLLLATWGYTPGKWIFGLQVRDREGGKLSWTAAMARTWLVFAKGEGFGIPVYNLYRNYKSYKACADCETLPWEEECGYAIKDLRVRRCWGFVGAAAALLVLNVFTVLQAQMPLHRGTITAAQYAENVNDMCAMNRLDLGATMDDQGKWVEDPYDNTIRIGLFAGDDGPPDHQLTLDSQGNVTGVRIEVELSDVPLVTPDTIQKQLAALSFAAATGGYNCVSWPSSGVLAEIQERAMEDYTLQAGGVTIRQQVEWQGYDGVSGSYLFAPEGTSTYYHMVFTLEKQV